MPGGSVKKFFADKGFGFIQPDDGTGDVFAPARTFAGDKFSIFEGMRVNFEPGADEKTGKPMAGSWFADGGQAQPPAGYGGGPPGGYGRPGGYGGMGGMGGFGGMGSAPAGAMGPGAGMLKKFYADKGYGFIARTDGSGDLFAPARTFSGQEHEIYEGMQVQFEAGLDDRNGKPRASSWGPIGGGACGMGGRGMDRYSPYGGAAPGVAAFGGGAATLPAGWESAPDPASGKTYYFNRSTGQTSWDPPAAAPALPQAPPPALGGLPPGWETAQDPSSGKTYYFNRATGATQWDAPMM